jgi:hypothetical protein
MRGAILPSLGIDTRFEINIDHESSIRSLAFCIWSVRINRGEAGTAESDWKEAEEQHQRNLYELEYRIRRKAYERYWGRKRAGIQGSELDDWDWATRRIFGLVPYDPAKP